MAQARRAVIFLHGWTMRGTVFDDQIARLGTGFSASAPDLAGHGAAAEYPARLNRAADQLAALIAGQTGVVLVGWSMGAAVAWRYAERFGTGRLAGLVTVDMSPRMVNDGRWRHGLIGLDAPAAAATIAHIRQDWPAAAEVIATSMFADHAGARAFSRSRALEQVQSNDPAAMGLMWSDLVAMDARAGIAGMAMPWLVCHGARSKVYPASASRWIVKRAPQARLVTFADSGHAPHLEEPACFAAELRAFLDRLGPVTSLP